MEFEYQANGMLFHYIQEKTDISIADILKIGQDKNIYIWFGVEQFL